LPDALQTDVKSEIARLRTAIDCEAASANRMLNEHPSASEVDYPRLGLAEHRELNRQLAALDECVARARSRGEDQLLLRAELATLLSFAKTLRGDAEAWRAALADGLKEVERQQATARAERDRLAAKRVALVRQRDALQSQIDQTAERMARASGGECRRTMPVLRLGADLSVCSVSVTSPRRGLRLGKSWLVTLNDSREEVVVRRSYA
jgi:hypothetical protein